MCMISLVLRSVLVSIRVRDLLGSWFLNMACRVGSVLWELRLEVLNPYAAGG